MLEKISALLSQYETRIYKDFENIVNINSFSTNPQGIEEMCEALLSISSDLGIVLNRYYSAQRARPHLLYGEHQAHDFYALIGHFDTVHPPESDFQKMWLDGDLLRGPGTNDMKSGLIVALYSLALLQTLFPEKTLPFKLLFNSDEEIGSLDSKEIIQDVFIGAKGGFVFEPGRIKDNSVVTARKGVFGLKIEIEGKASHSGTAPEKGMNAVVEAARIITLLDALNDHPHGISIGCNVVQGGIATNVVAPFCQISVDARYVEPEQEEMLLAHIIAILTAPSQTGAKITYKIQHGRPPMVKTEASDILYQRYKKVSESLGIPCGEMATGGGSDANFLSAMGIPVIDGVGAVGNHSHTKQEYTIKHSILDRIKIFTLLMAEEIGI